MIILVTGGSGSGKSEFAEKLLYETARSGKTIYCNDAGVR